MNFSFCTFARCRRRIIVTETPLTHPLIHFASSCLGKSSWESLETRRRSACNARALRSERRCAREIGNLQRGEKKIREIYSIINEIDDNDGNLVRAIIQFIFQPTIKSFSLDQCWSGIGKQKNSSEKSTERRKCERKSNWCMNSDAILLCENGGNIFNPRLVPVSAHSPSDWHSMSAVRPSRLVILLNEIRWNLLMSVNCDKIHINDWTSRFRVIFPLHRWQQWQQPASQPACVWLNSSKTLFSPLISAAVWWSSVWRFCYDSPAHAWEKLTVKLLYTSLPLFFLLWRIAAAFTAVMSSF